jgi:ubiquinone/menaquinone biosynthesis C-methylase UbiE
MLNESAKGQVTRSAAEVYEEFFVPALFEQWAWRTADAAGIRPGQRALDVACGTGVLTCAVADRIGPHGSVVGLDFNEAMLTLAGRKAPRIEWQRGRAESLPFRDEDFDAVVSQFGLMFFEHRRAALTEMLRVLRRGGRLAVTVWDSLDNTPGYAAVTELLQRLFGDRVADALRAPFSPGDRQALRALFADADIPEAEIMTLNGTARFNSIRSWITTEIKGWTLADLIDDAQFALLLAESEQALRRFAAADGSVAFVMPAHIVTATKA